MLWSAEKVPGTAVNAARAIDGEAPDEEKPVPEVPPPDFINCCKAVLLNFGNLNIDEERGDLSVQIKRIASEAEVVATRIYGKGMTQREQQVSPRVFPRVIFAWYGKVHTSCTNFRNRPSIISSTGPRLEGTNDIHIRPRAARDRGGAKGGDRALVQPGCGR